ncbi:LacI family DNA-binding transcriptional regulator [Promicromonospora iranensis]|uniref:LacI family DNA-binding transcriptional regulator n=1 Tax=Promicromonospora iranensis TaxID=1105144 RepID=UPI0023A9B27E|nr:LacI family DNA-binding transcriptional regulator [Promicromonospora iranensis]
MSAAVPPTSRDVARLAGVSQATVSYVLTGKGAISPATRERVLKVAESIGYRPNLAARSMRTRRSGRLAVITGVVAVGNQMRMLTGASRAADEAGYAMETSSVDGTVEDRTERVLELAAGGQYEGILTFVPVLPEALSDGGDTPPVLAATAFDEQMHSAGELAQADLMEVFVHALVAAGHRRFLHVAGSQEFASARARRDTYLACLAGLQSVQGLDAESLGVVGGEWSAESARQAVLALPDDAPPVAVLAANDMLAIGVLRGAAERGWSVPGDVVVTGWDNAAFGAYTMPSLTTVDVDFQAAGRHAMHLLIAALRGEAPPARGPALQRIVWRESSGAARPPR